MHYPVIFLLGEFPEGHCVLECFGSGIVFPEDFRRCVALCQELFCGLTKKNDFTGIGCAFVKPSEEVRNNLGITRGMQVSGLKAGSFRDAGIKDGFIILEINNKPVSTADDIEKIYNEVMKSSDRVMFITGIYPTGKKVYYAVDLSE